MSLMNIRRYSGKAVFQVVIKYHKRLQSDLKNLPKVKILKFRFLNWNFIIFDVLILK